MENDATDEARRRRRLFGDAPERVLARRLRELREAAGMTQLGLAERMTRQGFPMRQSTIAKIEANQRPVRVNEASMLAGILGLELPDLIADSDANGEAAALFAEFQEAAGRRLEARAQLSALRAQNDEAELKLREAVKRLNDLEELEHGLRRRWLLARKKSQGLETGADGDKAQGT